MRAVRTSDTSSGTEGSSSDDGSDGTDGSGSDSDDSSRSYSDDEDEEEQPLLKYQRIGSYVTEVLAEEYARSLLVCTRQEFIVIGMQSGLIVQLDLRGTLISRWVAHKHRVNQLSADASGTFIASCSEDGTVCVRNVATSEQVSFSYSRALAAIALDPGYAKKRDKIFACGGVAGQFILNRKGWFTHANTTVHEGEGAVTAISWQPTGGLIAWANAEGVKIYDVDREMRISYIERPRDLPDGIESRCSLAWEDSDALADQLIIGWGRHIKIIRIMRRASAATSAAGAMGLSLGLPASLGALAPSSAKSDLYAEIIGLFELPCVHRVHLCRARPTAARAARPSARAPASPHLTLPPIHST